MSLGRYSSGRCENEIRDTLSSAGELEQAAGVERRRMYVLKAVRVVEIRLADAGGECIIERGGGAKCLVQVPGFSLGVSRLKLHAATL